MGVDPDPEMAEFPLGRPATTYDDEINQHEIMSVRARPRTWEEKVATWLVFPAASHHFVLFSPQLHSFLGRVRANTCIFIRLRGNAEKNRSQDFH